MYNFQRGFIVACMLLLLQVAAQAAQKNQSDLDFIARMNQQAVEMYEKANKLDARLAAVSSKTDGKKKRNKIRDDIKLFKAKIRDEQKQMDGKDFKKGESRKDQEKRMQKMQEQLRQIEADMYVQGYSPDPAHDRH
jgi:Skp family chaperone for outer membrane proteins